MSVVQQPRAMSGYMVEAFVIIVALGGLEFVLWYLDHKQQKRQIDLLDSIWAELAIKNSEEDERSATKGHETERTH